MTVNQLIKELELVDQTKEVKFYGTDFNGVKQKYVTIDEIAEGRFVEIISKENDGRK